LTRPKFNRVFWLWQKWSSRQGEGSEEKFGFRRPCLLRGGGDSADEKGLSLKKKGGEGGFKEELGVVSASL